MSGIFGGANQFTGAGQNQSTATSSASNQAYPYLQSALSPMVSNSGSANSQLANMLGLNGPQSQSAGFNNWKDSTGYQFGLDQGTAAITGNAATQGLLNSGSTLKALNTYGQNYANTQYQNYLNPLESLMNSGLTAASTIGSAGTVANSNSQSSGTTASPGGGLGGLLGGLLGK